MVKNVRRGGVVSLAPGWLGLEEGPSVRTAGDYVARSETMAGAQ